MKKRLHLTIILALILANFISASSQQPSPAMVAASELQKAQKWPEAATAYEAVLKDEPNNAAAWYQLGMVRYSMKRYAEAADAFQHNVAISNSGFVMYNLACVYSLGGEKEKAIEWLTKTVNNPKMVLSALNFSDPDLDAIKADPRFKELAEKVDLKVRPCMHSDEAKQFNFWIGEWDVYNPQGRRDGNSVIQSFAAGCGILENWRDTFGNTGKSINFYDPDAKKWFQYWIGQTGGPLRYSGIYKDGAIRYESETIDSAGKKTLGRLTFFNLDANTVRQFAEISNDEGKTWTTSYDYKYVRRASAEPGVKQ